LATTLILAVLHSHRTKTGGSLMRRSLATMPMAPAGPLTEPSAFPGVSQPPAATAPGAGSATPSTATPSPSAPAQSSPAAAAPQSVPTAPQSSPAPKSP
jgi:hypothetical protein